MTSEIDYIFACQKVSAGTATGDVLISRDDICFFLVEPETGILKEKGHDLEGKTLAGKVLVFPSGKGSAVVQDEGLFAMKAAGNMPAALIIDKPDTVLVFGAIVLGLPVVNNVEPAANAFLRDNIRAVVDADAGQITILSN
jgi:hypothetical protein